MSDDPVAQLREMVMRLMALALSTCQEGDAVLSEQIVVMALQLDEKANALEAGAAKPNEE